MIRKPDLSECSELELAKMLEDNAVFQTEQFNAWERNVNVSKTVLERLAQGIAAQETMAARLRGWAEMGA